MTDDIRRKFYTGGLQVIKAEGAKRRQIGGFATTFEEPQNYDSDGEIFGESAFDEAMAQALAGERKIKMLDSHGRPVGLWTAFEKMRAPSGAMGIFVKGELANTALGDEVAELIDLGVTDGLSVGIRLRGSEAEETGFFTSWGAPVMRWTKANWYETSTTPFPANENARIMALKSERRERLAREYLAKGERNHIQATLEAIDLECARLEIERMSMELDRLTRAIRRSA